MTQYPTTAFTTISTTTSTLTPLTRRTTTNNPSEHVNDGGESYCIGGKWDSCMSAKIKILLGGWDSGRSDIGRILVVVVLMVGYWW